MKRNITRVVLILLGILIVLVLVAGSGGLTIVRRPFPQTAGTLEIPGLQEEVQVYRDEYGIPHIYAQNEADLFLAQGYVHAQDRFWQMEFWRHIGQGRVSEITGSAGVSSDKYIRTFGWNRIAEDIVAYYQAEAPEFYAILEAYSNGVNAYISENEDQLAMQITVLGLVQEPWQIEPWTPLNTVSWGVVMSDDLATNWDNEIGRLKRMQQLSETERAALTPGYPYDDRPVIVTAEELAEGRGKITAVTPTGINWNQISARLIGSPPPDYLGLGDGPFVGSNNWVVSGEHTASGLPLLANDPHLGVQMPSIWYEVGLHAPTLNVVGFSFAGVPGVIVGHTENIAWGVTTSGPDVQDLYIERLNPDNPNQYEYMGEWHEMEIVEEVIKVNGGEDVTLPVRITRHGPIVTERITDEEDQISDVLSVRWAAFEPSRILQSVVLLNRAQNHDDFLEAMRFWDVPSQSVVYADVAGNIAYFMSGRVPIRKNGDGAVPVPGWTDEYEWTGWIPHEELPATLNPNKGFIVTANNAVVADDAYPYHLAYDYSTGDRAQRIESVLQTAIAHGDKFTVEDFTRLQMDNKSLPAEAFAPLLVQVESDDPEVREALAYLTSWDFQEDADSVAAALWEITFLHLGENALGDEVGADNLGLIDRTVAIYDLAANPEATWWDDTSTPQTETAVSILEQSLDEAITWFQENQGGEMADWTWGKIHTITFRDGVLGQSGIGALESMVNRGPFPVGGSSSIVNANSWSRSNPAAVRGHPSMRMVVDMSDLAASQAIHPTGQSGHPYHPHYDDMIPLWLAGDYHPMRWDRETVEETAVDTLILQPAQ